MNCSCGGKTKVTHTGVYNNKIVRYRKCSICGKKIKTIELNVEQRKNEKYIIKKLKEIIKEVEK